MQSELCFKTLRGISCPESFIYYSRCGGRRELNMTQYLIMCRSLTNAQKSAKLLERNGIFGNIIKAPHELSGRGCGYAVSLHRGIDAAIAILTKNDLISGKIYARDEDDNYTEVIP